MGSYFFRPTSQTHCPTANDIREELQGLIIHTLFSMTTTNTFTTTTTTTTNTTTTNTHSIQGKRGKRNGQVLEIRIPWARCSLGAFHHQPQR